MMRHMSWAISALKAKSLYVLLSMVYFLRHLESEEMQVPESKDYFWLTHHKLRGQG